MEDRDGDFVSVMVLKTKRLSRSSNLNQRQFSLHSAPAKKIKSVDLVSKRSGQREKMVEKLQLMFTDVIERAAGFKDISQSIEESIYGIFSSLDDDRSYLAKCRDCIFNLKKNSVRNFSLL